LRKPSQLAGFGDLQAFLQRGMEALRHMGPIAPFIDTVTTRERRLMTELLVGDPALLEWYPPDGGEKAP